MGRPIVEKLGRPMYAYLTILTGNKSGTNIPLTASGETLIGRGTDCHVTLADPLCSRVHARPTAPYPPITTTLRIQGLGVSGSVSSERG